MGEMVSFKSNGSTCEGYLATAKTPGPGVVVIQEWWGLVDQVKDVAERLASEGFTALAPDLYHGTSTKEPDAAQKLMMDLNIEEAARDMSGAVDFLSAHVSTKGKIGSVGFCMGGALSITLATIKPIAAPVSFYGLPMRGEPDYTKLIAPVLLHAAEKDDWVSPAAAQEFAAKLKAAGKTAEMHVYPGTDHAFFNETRPDVYDKEAAMVAWDRTLAFFRTNLS